MSARRQDVPWFVHEGELRRVPDGPTHCACGAELERLRRYGGMCRACVAARAAAAGPPPKPTDRLRSSMTLVGVEMRARPGHTTRERFAIVRCSCGVQRSIYYHLWIARPPACCKACRLRAVEASGFEPEQTR